MIVKEKYQVEQERVVEKRCDLCNKKAIMGYGEYGWNDMDEDPGDATRVEASLIEHGYHVDYRYDICPRCFRQRLMPILNGEYEPNKLEQIKSNLASRRELAVASVEAAEQGKDRDMVEAAKRMRDLERAKGFLSAIREIETYMKDM